MTKNWAQIRSILKTQGQAPGVFLSLITGEGIIEHANSRMLKTFHLKNPRETENNFFDLIHPAYRHSFRSALQACGINGNINDSELSLKNGYYHSMKWHISRLMAPESKSPRYLCIGYQVVTGVNKNGKPVYPGLKHYQEIINGLNEGIILQNRKGDILSINQKAMEILGVTNTANGHIKTTKALWDSLHIHSEDEGARTSFEESPFLLAQTTGQYCSSIFTVKSEKEDCRLIRFSSQPLPDDESDHGYSVVTSISDITPELFKQKPGLKANAFFADFMRDTPNLAWIVDENEYVVAASNFFYKYFGLNEKITREKKITDLLPANISEPMFGKHIRVFRTGKSTDTIERVVWPNGKRINFHITIFPINGPAGCRLIGGYALSVSDSQAAEKKLREANERLLMISKATNDAIWEWDMKSEAIFRNDALMDMIGYDPDESKGLSWWLQRIHPEDRERLNKKVRASIEEKRQSWQDEYRFKCADGSYRYMRDKGFIVYENGLPVRMIGSLQDLTDLRNLQTELTEEKLTHQKNISETVIRVQEKERTRIGHELHDNVNQILSTAKLFVDQLHVTKTVEKQFKKKSIDYLMLAIEEIRKLSKELVTPQLRDTTLVESLGNLIGDIKLSANIEIKYTYSNDVDMAGSGKKLTLYRIAQEQLKNILKYSEATKVDILLTCKNDIVSLCIKDNGVGFDISKPVKGIGLMNIEERVRFYNGEVCLDTAPGKGCTLEVLLPLQ